MDSNNTNQTGAFRPLFRKQAVEQVSASQYGTVVLASTVSQKVIVTLFSLIAFGIVLFFCLFSTTRKAQCIGLIMPTSGVVKIAPAQAGIITKTFVKEGDLVKAGQVLFVISGERTESGDGTTEKKLAALMLSRRDSFTSDMAAGKLQLKQRLEATARRAMMLDEEAGQINSQILLQTSRVKLAEQKFKQFADLQATNYVSLAQLQEREAELLDQRQRLADLHRLHATARRETVAALQDRNELSLQAQRDDLAISRNVAALDQDLTENGSRKNIAVRAPIDGTVSAVTAIPGQTVTAGISLAALLPAGSRLEAEIHAPSRAAGFVKPGMKVLLRYQAYPYQKFGQYAATVREVASTSLRPEELAAGAIGGSGSGEPVYRIKLTLQDQAVLAYGKQMPLKAGMLVDASILLEDRRLYEWILEPIFSISGRL